MKIKKIIKKSFPFILLFNLIFWNSVGSAQALFGGGASVPSTEEILNDIETHYGFDGNILRRSSLKGNYPQVEIFFDKTAPKVGDEVTATALPKYFKNSNEKLYYTWFLFRDGEDDIEAAKQLAMGLVARGDFDPFLFGTDYSGGSDDDDTDGYDASYGGDDGVGGKTVVSGILNYSDYESNHYVSPTSKQLVDTTEITRCYRHNFGVSSPNETSLSNAGEDLIVYCEHKFPEAPEGESFTDPLNPSSVIECEDDYEVGDGEFTNNEEACWRLDPNNADTDGDGIEDEADLAGLGQEQLTWTFQAGDQVGVIIEGTSMVSINESASSQVALPATITYNCSGVLDETYCVNSSYQVGECIDGTCTSTDCSESGSSDHACELSGGGTGICDSGSCVAVSSCSSNGDLCESQGIEGVCYNSSCVLSRCGSEGSSCQTNIGTLGYCDDGYCEELLDSSGDASMNPYYKILWAGLDTCDEEKVDGEDKEDLIDDDECEGSNDYGFTYLATKTVTETNDDLLKSSLIFTPEEPQADHSEHDYSDYITVKAGINQSGVNEEFVYYDWDIYYCYEDEILGGSCTEKINRKLTSYCYEGDVLGECASSLESDSMAEGMGVSEIKFRGSEDFYNAYQNSEKLYFKVFLKTKKSEDAVSAGLSTAEIPVGKNDVGITFLKLTKDGDSYDAEEICTSGNYAKICPVYTGQLLAVAHKKNSSLNIESFSWEVDNSPLVNKNNSINWTPVSSDYDNYSIFPITETGITLQTVSLNTKKTNGEEITSERIISAAEPMAKIVSNDLNTAWYWVVDDGTETGKTSENVMVAKIGETVSLKADMVPSYLNDDLNSENISLNWYINENEITEDFINKNSGNEISLNDQSISFVLSGSEGDSVSLDLEVIKEYSDEEKALLKSNWGIDNIKNQVTKKSIIIKQTESSATGSLATNSMAVFMASTFQNAPDYFVFIIRTAIVFVLFWSLVYGMNYWTRSEIKLEK